MTIIMFKSASDGIKKLSNYIGNVNELYDYIDKLAYFPEMGRCVPEINKKNFRELIFRKYRILYEVSKETQTVFIHFIVHSRMDLNKLLKNNPL